MKLALFTHLPWPENVSQQDVFQGAVEQVQVAESSGYHSAWFAEHHFTRYSMGASLGVILGHMAAATQKIRLGTGVIVPVLHNPIRIAEDTATVDILSGGRLDVGFGRGVYSYEYGGFGIPEKDSQKRFRESVLSVQDMLTTRPVSLEGDFYSLRNIDLVPSPIQKPHPPIYIAASRSAETLEFLVENQFLLCIAVVQDTKHALELVSRYKKLCSDSARPSNMSEVPFFRYVHVSETEERAIEATKQHIEWIQDIMQWRRFLMDSTEVDKSILDWRRERSELPPRYEYIRENRAFIGTPEQVAEKILYLKSEGIEYFGANFAMAGLSQKEILATMSLFEDKVMPLIV